MFWHRDNKIVVHHVDGTITGRGPVVYWGTPHAFGWDKLQEAIERLQVLTASIKNCSIKEKYGGIRLYAFADEKGIKELRQAYRVLVKEMPGVEDFLAADFQEEAVVWEGDSDEEMQKFLKNNFDKTKVDPKTGELS